MTGFADYLGRMSGGAVLSEGDMQACIALLMEGGVADADAALFLTTLAQRGETASEIAGAARALRARAQTIDAPPGAIDCCGTGGDGRHTYNISTAVALVAAACGVPVAKHGNRSSTSRSGAADVLERLGVNLDAPREKLESALRDLNFCFLMAPRHHAAMKHVAGVRRALGTRTIFNLLGPLANPAGTTKQLVGVYDRKWLRPMADALQSLGTKKALIVHGGDGLDEITLCADTHAVVLDRGAVHERTLTPADFGLDRHAPDEIRGGDVNDNAQALVKLLEGAAGGYRDMVLANTAAVLWLHDGTNFTDGVKIAADAIDSGKALAVLENYKRAVA